ncbi:MAG: hypothetical protein KGJ86_15730 [Chloroflexota bacterium]|nr:hypothetical protein [Chloroflexota bacterium]
MNPTEYPGEHTGHQAGSRGGHGWMMIVCCIPMLAIAVALVVSGVVSAGFLIVALACVALMALMMRGTSGHTHG